MIKGKIDNVNMKLQVDAAIKIGKHTFSKESAELAVPYSCKKTSLTLFL